MEMKDKKEVLMQLFERTYEMKLIKGNIKASNNVIETIKTQGNDPQKLLDPILEGLVADTERLNGLQELVAQLKKEIKFF